MSRVLQYTSFPASDKFKTDRAPFEAALQKIATVDGHVHSFWGQQSSEEGGKNAYVITVWESASAHSAFANTDTFKSLFSTLQEGVASGGSITRSQLTAVKGNPRAAFEKPVTEIALVTPKSGASADAVKQAAIAAGDVFESNGYPSALGEATDGTGVIMIVIGWPSVEESRSKIKEEPFASPVGAFHSIATLDLAHATLDKHT